MALGISKRITFQTTDMLKKSAKLQYNRLLPNDIYTLLCHRWFWCYTREPPKMLPGDLARARHFPVKITPHFLSPHAGGYFNVKMHAAFSCWQKGCLPRRTVATKAESKTEMCASACSGQVSTNAPGALGDIPLLQLMPTFQHPTNRRCRPPRLACKICRTDFVYFPHTKSEFNCASQPQTR